MFLTISMFWQWQNKQLFFFFFQADFKSMGHFFEITSKHCCSRLCSFVSLLVRYVLLATEKHPWGWSNEDQDFSPAWHWPSLKGWWLQGAAGPILLWHCKVCQGILLTTKWMAVGWQSVLFCNIFLSRCPKFDLSTHCQRNPFLHCRASTRPVAQFTPLEGCRFTPHTSAFHPFFLFL